MKKSLTLEILNHLVTCGIPLVVSGLLIPYGTTFGQALRDTERRAAKCPHDFSLHSRRTLSATLCRLKKQGLVKNKGPHNTATWYITKYGKHHFVSVNTTNKPALPAKDGKIRLIVFDIPEEQRRQRDWLRLRLRSCDYAPFQKSVWIGMRPLPKKLLSEFRERGVTEYIHVVGLEEVLKNVKMG